MVGDLLAEKRKKKKWQLHCFLVPKSMIKIWPGIPTISVCFSIGYQQSQSPHHNNQLWHPQLTNAKLKNWNHTRDKWCMQEMLNRFKCQGSGLHPCNIWVLSRRLVALLPNQKNGSTTPKQNLCRLKCAGTGLSCHQTWTFHWHEG